MSPVGLALPFKIGPVTLRRFFVWMSNDSVFFGRHGRKPLRKFWSALFAVASIAGMTNLLLHFTAIAQVEPSAAAVPSDAELDAMLAARNWTGLSAVLWALRVDTAVRLQNWLHTRIVSTGGALLLDLVYIRNLWLAGNAKKIDDPVKDPLVNAGAMALYTYAIIIIDGSKCEDVSAPESRRMHLLTDYGEALRFLKGRPASVKSTAVDAAISLEEMTAPVRKDDDLICRAGMAQIMAGLERGTQQEIPNRPGVPGRSIGVTPPPDWAPKFASPEVYKPKQAEARAMMPELLHNLMGLPH